MKVLILAAGIGTRISRFLSGDPKCMVDIGNKKLIQYTVELLMSKGIEEIGLVLGYRAHVIRDALSSYPVRFFYNPFYDVTNSIASAWFSKDFLGDFDDTIIMNGDVFVEEKMLEMILASPLSPVMFADGSRKEHADYKFFFQDSKLLKFGKELEGDDISGEYIGIGKFSKEFMPAFLDKLNTLIYHQKHGAWWEDAIYSFVNERPVFVEDLAPHFWAEVDYLEDYERIMKFRGYKVNLNLQITRL